MSARREMPLEALLLAAWARIWSPTVPQALFEEAWGALDLPADPALRDMRFCSTFHSGFPAPRVPLLLHAALNRSGDEARSDMLRAMAHLGIGFGDHILPPDHLAIACEVAASAIVNEEPVIVRELGERYLIPWCHAAVPKLDQEDAGLRDVVGSFLTLCREMTSA